MTSVFRRLSAQPREVVVLVAVAFSVALGFGVVAPAIPLFAREFGVGRTAAGLVVSAFALMRLVAALSSGRLVDRLGERRVLAAGIAVVAVSSGLAGLATSYGQLLVLRGVGGIGSAMFTISATSLLLRAVGPERRGQAAGLFQGGFLLGGIAGPAVGGAVTGISLRAPFFLYAATLVVAGGVGLLLLPRDEEQRRMPPDPDADADVPATDPAADVVAPTPAPAPAGTTLRDALRLPAYRAALACWFGHSWATFGIRAAVVPLFVTEGLDADPVWVGVGFALSAGVTAVALVPGGRLADRVGRRPALLAGAASTAAGMVLLAVSSGVPMYLVAMAVVGVGGGLLGPAPAAVVGDVAGDRGRGGTVVAAYSMSGDAGAVLGPVVGGALASGPGFGAAFLATGAVLAGGFAATLAAPETRRASTEDRRPPTED